MNVVAGLTAFCLFLTVALTLRAIVFRDVPQNFLLFAFSAQIFGLLRTFDVIVPPSILVLSASTSTSISILANLNSELTEYRAIALLLPKERIKNDIVNKVFFNNIRTRSIFEWRSVVFHLMDVVPLIIVNDRSGGEALNEEIDRIHRKNYLDRTIFLSNWPGLAPTEDGKYHHPDGGPAWAAILRSRLTDLADHEERKKRQSTYNEILKAVPTGCRYPTTLLKAVHKARFVQLFVSDRFLRECKGLDPRGPEASLHLLEDMPSVGRPEDELEFLRNNRGVEEVEILLRGAIKASEESDDPHRHFNIANAYNSLGIIARFTREWQKAIRLIEEAMRRLEPLTSDTDDGQAAIQELGTAHFTLGDIYMARFRETNKDEYRSIALEHFDKSVALDQQLGLNTDAARYRLSLL